VCGGVFWFGGGVGGFVGSPEKSSHFPSSLRLPILFGITVDGGASYFF